ncbi:hypothetical protein NAL32_04360 [Chryseobacterium sp. Ch-15]|uniref:Uncharacterized protein n=1 Tax=Chryseobacterium muglaense TaxID=2893752 RepID=A0A9Q3YRI4_9FLAO|nr:hypothetical protein [Chryseobacterium muglaense]MBD3903972.1 hypothetical protein [Chryseobacterium muglaense]MCC9032842.1 hypothetical protein [Chryseobacterium muglaense]MCM2553621.1 hypothetical protein [Chryseobacterium muglaense]
MKTFLQLYLFLISTTMCSQQNIPSKQINDNLDIGAFAESTEDKSLLKGNVFTIKSYTSDNNQKKSKDDKTFEGKTLHLINHTVYRKDGRRSSRKEISGSGISNSKYYYNESSGNLILKESHYDRKYGKTQYSSWFFYDKNQVISEEINLEKNEAKTSLSNYIKYKVEDSASQKKTTVSQIGSDSLSNPDKTYIFNQKNLTKISPLYQSKVQKLSLLNNIYKVDEIEDYVVEGRKVHFKYDKKGRQISEIWYDKEGLENKNEFSYNNDNTESIESQYHLRGTEISSKNYKKYDQYGNIIFDQTKYYDGSIGSIEEFEYQYDKEGNWIVKKRFYSEANNGIIGKKKLTTAEIREIEYYTKDSQQKGDELPKTPEIINEIRKNLPKIVKENDSYLNEKKRAIETNSYDEEITLKESDDIKNFTPKYWELKEIAYGNLDEDENDEAVAVYEMPNIDREDAEQVLAIYKKQNGKWKITRQTSAPLLSSQSGGMMGNPFNGISISKKSIVIDHFGGSRDKWEYTHRYRFQNGDWFLIGASASFGAPCDYWVKFDYNISTGDATYQKTVENCEKGEKKVVQSQKLNKKITPPKMDTVVPGDSTFKFPNVKDEIYY